MEMYFFTCVYYSSATILNYRKRQYDHVDHLDIKSKTRIATSAMLVNQRNSGNNRI